MSDVETNSEGAAEAEDLTGVAAEADQTDQTTQTADGEDADVESAELTDKAAETQDEDYEDVEINGVTYSVPKPLAAERMMHADYTRKTQEVAQTRKALETDREALVRERNAVAQQVEAERAFVEERAKVAVIESQIEGVNAQIEEYGKVDWSSLDDATHALHSRNYNELVRQAQALTATRDRTLGEFNTKVQAKLLETQQESAKRRQEGVAKLPTIIPGWNAEVADKTAAFALSEGLTAEEVRATPENPVHVRLLWLASLGAESLKQKAQVKRIAPAQKTAPVQTLRGTSGKFTPAPDTSDFKAFDKMADDILAKR